MGLGMLLLVGPLAASASAATSTPAPALDSTFANLLNTLRTTLGIGGLAVDPQLSDVARAWSTHMATTGVMAHNPAVTTQVQSWAKLGENVGTGGAVSQIFDALVASPPHMRNMSDGDFTRVGIGTVTDAKGRLWTTHVFMRPKTAGAVAAPAPTAAPTTKAPAPVTTRAPRPVPTTAAPVTAPPTPAAPVTAPPPPVPVTVPVAAAASALPTEAAIPTAAPAMDPLSATPPPSQGTSPVVLVGIGLLLLLALAGGGALVLRAGRRPTTPALPSTFARPSRPVSPPVAEKPAEDLTKVLDLLYN